MSESSQHYSFVNEIIQYVKNTYPWIEEGCYYVDRPEYDKPFAVGESCIPDFYCESGDTLIIGEAKTALDIDNQHTRKQFRSYVNRCRSASSNEDYTGHIIYMVPNEYQILTKNLLKKELDSMPGEHVDVQVKSPLSIIVEKTNNSNQGIIVRREPPFETKYEGFEYQKAAVNIIKNLEYSAIFHEQGLGKTKIAMDLLVYWLKEKVLDTVLVVTKKSLVLNWKKEFLKHTTIVPRIMTGSKKDNYFVLNSPARAIVTNYETIVSEKERIVQFARARPLGVGIILDESAKIKNVNSKLTQTFLQIGPEFKKRVIMTGTPVANRPADIWSQIYFLDQGNSLGTNYSEFEKEVDLSNKLYSDKDKQQELSDALSLIFGKIEKFTVRETKNSGIIHLPNKEYFSIEISFDYPQKIMYDKVRREQFLEIIKDDQITIDDNSEIIKRLVRLIEITSNPAIVDDQYSRRPPKIDALIQLVKQIDERGEKVIVWTMFTENIKLIKKYLSQYNPVLIYGKMTMKERNNSVEDFMTDPSVKVLIATNAAKEGLTLTVANNAIFYDRSLSLDDYLQAQDRIHRISQTADCNIYNIKIRDSIDMWIDSLLCAKQLAAQLAQGDITQTEYDSKIDYSYGEIIKQILSGED